MRAVVVRLVSLASFLALAGAASASCSQGNGTGSITGVLNVPDCWSGAFDLQPNFFAAIPYDNTLQLRIQNGGTYETFSDGVDILIDDTTKIRPAPGYAGLYGQALEVDLPAGVTAPGVPIVPNANPANVHLVLYLQRSCETQNVALYAMESVTLNAEGGCDPRDGGAPVVQCGGSSLGLADPDAGASTSTSDGGTGDAGATSTSDGGTGDGGATSGPVGHSTMTIESLFNGNVDEVSAAERLNQGTFQVYLADPRETCPGGVGPPPPCRGFLTGSFNFYFERGQPEQPYP